MKILAFGASYSSNSINQKLASFAAAQFPGAQTEILDLRKFQLPLFTTDLEAIIGHPHEVNDFLSRLDHADLIIISLAEHNGSYSTAFKNLFDWASRVKVKMFERKKLLLLSTAPGPRGGLSVLKTASERFPIHGAEIVGTFSLPHFHENFSEHSGIIHEELNEKFRNTLDNIKV